MDDDPRRRERRWVWGLGAVFVVMLVAGVGAGVASVPGGPDEPGTTAGDWALLLGIPVAVMVLVAAGVLGFARWRRRRGSALFARSPLWELPTQKQRRSLVRDLRRGRPVAPEHRELALRTARDLTRRRGLVWLYVGIAVVQGFNVVIEEGWIRWVSLAGVLLFLAAATSFAWLIARMRRAVDRLEQSPTVPSP